MEYILEIENLHKSYNGKTEVLEDFSFKLEYNKICAVVGESGCGKSTLLRLIAGLEQPEKGVIKIKDKVVTNETIFLPPQDRNVGMVFQNFSLFPHLTVRKNILFGMKEKNEALLDDLLETIGMQAFKQAYPSMLSGGQEQRVAIARALALNPELLLMDEPFSNLDAELKSKLRQEIRSIIKKIGASMIFITHDIHDAIDIADQIIYIKHGKIIRQNSKEAFFKDNTNPHIQATMDDLRKDARKLLDILRPS